MCAALSLGTAFSAGVYASQTFNSILMRTRLRELIGPALFEATFVVLGVVIAYLANEWREKRVHREDAAAAKRAIVAELTGNRAAAKASLAYHTTLLDTLRKLQRANVAPTIQVFTRGFMSPAQLGATAWEVASQTGVLNHMAYADMLRFSHVYAEQRRYDLQSTGVSSVIYTELYRAGPMEMAKSGLGISSLIGTFQYRERALVALYDSVITESSKR